MLKLMVMFLNGYSIWRKRVEFDRNANGSQKNSQEKIILCDKSVTKNSNFL